MGRPYTVRSGDSLSSIAARNGYSSWEEIYNHDDNREFRQRRPNPNRIRAGDVLYLPDRAGGSTGADPAPEGAQPAAPAPSSAPPSTATPGAAPRRTPSGQDRAVLNSAYELREIVAAQGIERHNDQLPENWRIPRSLESQLPNNREHEWVRIDDTSAEFVSHTQRVRFRLRVVNTKDEYKRALETAGLHVIYGGHARYGRGPCFGPSADASDDWENGTANNTNTRGLFRMGYPVMLIPVTDIEHHGYRFNPVPTSQTVQASWYNPNVPRGRLQRIAVGELPTDLQTRVSGSSAGSEYWGRKTGQLVTDVLLWAGWENTVSAPMDLGATNLRCRCFCHFGCSSKVHNWRIVRERKNWRRTDTDRFAYFTTAPSQTVTAKVWLQALFEYSQPNGFQSWHRSLEWARVRGTQLLRSRGLRYSIW